MDKYRCEICGEEFTGELARLNSEKCRDSHEKVYIEIWDFELPQVVSFINTGDRRLLPKQFLRHMRALSARALRGHL